MGCVDAALDPVIGRRVAIKTLRDEYRDDDLAASRFAEEARVTGQLEHPNIVPIYDLGEDPLDPFIVMRLVQGKSLMQLLESSPRPSTAVESADLLQRLVGIVLSLCDALAFAHSRGVFHCDVKPDNVMVGDHGQVYLMDWGVALTDRPREGFGGTAAYMAPEQLLGRTQDIDARTDIFGLGGVLYEILNGHPPNDGAALVAAARGEAQPSFSPGPLWTRLPPELCRITARALAPAREDRYQTIAALRLDLEQFLKGGGWFETLTFQAGDSIVTEGETGDAAYIIQSGNCEVWKNVQGQRRLIRLLGPGDVFGETAVLAPGPRTASIVAASAVTLKVITGESLNRELDQNPILASFVRSLANLFRETDAAFSVPPPPASR
jgi:eukaryotic-like serine/threonine-protein kinase